MNESRNVFWDRIEKTHIQRDEINEFYRLCQEGKAFSGIEKEEFEALINDLNNDQIQHSNHMVVDMIINDVMEYTNNFKLKKILKNQYYKYYQWKFNNRKSLS